MKFPEFEGGAYLFIVPIHQMYRFFVIPSSQALSDTGLIDCVLACLTLFLSRISIYGCGFCFTAWYPEEWSL